jgi:hypothetical protein
MRLALISITAVAALPIQKCVQLKAVGSGLSNSDIRPVVQVNYCPGQGTLYFRKPENSRIAGYEIERHGKFECFSRRCTFSGLKKQPESLSLYGSGDRILSLFYLVPADGCYTVPAVGQAGINAEQPEIKATFCLRPGRKLEVTIQKPRQCLKASQLDLQPTFEAVLSEPTAMECTKRTCKSMFGLNLVENEENVFKLTCGINPKHGGRLELLFPFKPRELQPMDHI